jgi:hypothetical protein
MDAWMCRQAGFQSGLLQLSEEKPQSLAHAVEQIRIQVDVVLVDEKSVLAVLAW